VRKKLFTGAAIVAIAAFVASVERPKTVDFTQADQRASARYMSFIEDANAQNTPPINVPTNLGVWGATTIFLTSTSNPIAAPSGSTTRNYVDTVECFSTSSTALVGKIFLDGAAATTVRGYFNCPPSAANGGITIFNPPLQLNAGAAVTVKIDTASGTQYLTVHSFQAR
jgi:hypothetical protein